MMLRIASSSLCSLGLPNQATQKPLTNVYTTLDWTATIRLRQQSMSNQRGIPQGSNSSNQSQQTLLLDNVIKTPNKHTIVLPCQPWGVQQGLWDCTLRLGGVRVLPWHHLHGLWKPCLLPAPHYTDLIRARSPYVCSRAISS